MKATLTSEGHRREFMRLLRENAYRYDLWTVWSDFVEMAAIAMANVFDLRQKAAREARYMQMIKRWTPEERHRFAKALAELTMAMELAGYDDVLGRSFMELELGNKWAGQFFTPYHLCQAMARITLGNDVAAKVKADGFITANDPAVGGGAMVIALAQAMHDQGLNYQTQLHVTAQDIDAKAVHMTYVQLSLLHVPATVIVGNTLALETREVWYTPAHIMGGWTHRLRARGQGGHPLIRHSVPEQPKPTMAAAGKAKKLEGLEQVDLFG